MSTPVAFAFTMADAVAAAITAGIAATTFDDATVESSEEFVLDAAAMPADGSLIVRVVPIDQRAARGGRGQGLEDRAFVVIQVASLITGEITAAKRRAPANYAVNLFRYFLHRGRYGGGDNAAAIVEEESEVETLFDDEVFRAIGCAMAAVLLVFRKQAATT